MKERQELFLQLRKQVNKQVTADQEINPGKGRIHDDILGRKNNHIADLFAHPVTVFLLDKKAVQSFRVNICGNIERI